MHHNYQEQQLNQNDLANSQLDMAGCTTHTASKKLRYYLHTCSQQLR